MVNVGLSCIEPGTRAMAPRMTTGRRPLKCMRCRSEGRPQRRPFLTVVPDYAGIQTNKRAAGFVVEHCYEACRVTARDCEGGDRRQSSYMLRLDLSLLKWCMMRNSCRSSGKGRNLVD